MAKYSYITKNIFFVQNRQMVRYNFLNLVRFSPKFYHCRYREDGIIIYHWTSHAIEEFIRLASINNPLLKLNSPNVNSNDNMSFLFVICWCITSQILTTHAIYDLEIYLKQRNYFLLKLSLTTGIWFIKHSPGTQSVEGKQQINTWWNKQKSKALQWFHIVGSK